MKIHWVAQCINENQKPKLKAAHKRLISDSEHTEVWKEGMEKDVAHKWTPKASRVSCAYIGHNKL
jgi:hypothetical protein